MKAPKIPHLMMALIIVSCCAVLGSCESIAENNGNSTASCISQLLPCQPYLNKTTSPPSACCVPLKQMVTGNTQCLCYIFNNPALLMQLNITQADALALAQKCSANADISVCKAGTPGTSTPSIPGNRTAPSDAGTAPSNAANTRNGHPFFHVGGFSFTATGVALVTSLAIYLLRC